jgi:Calmodulin-binding
MPDDERLSTLNDLITARKATNDLLEKLPIVIKSLKMATHKRELEEKMTKLERAIETFSKKKVYV